MRLRDYTPRGYNARNILILIVPMMTFVIAMTLFFFYTHVEQVNAKLSRAVADELSFVMRHHEEKPEDWDSIAKAMSDAGLMSLSFTPGVTVLEPPRGNACCDQLRDELSIRFPAGNWAYRYLPDDFLTIRILGPRGLYEARMDRKRVIIITAHIFIVWSVAFGVLLLLTSYLFLRNQVRSILQLSWAADAFGRGEDMPNFKPSGAIEVRKAARSLLRMRNRIRRYADQRTDMLAGVSHDLRTPLTRMKLSLALLPESPETRELADDVVDMERMIEGYLAFARGEGDEDTSPTDLSDILEDVAAGARRNNANIEVTWQGDMNVELRPLAMKRCLTNLVGNALRHGTVARLQAVRGRTSVEIIVDDNGPGIPPDKYEDVFRPFFRLDQSRNVDTGGVGLGLTIARDIARSHGGDVSLAASPLGGLRVIVRIPI